MKSQNPTPLNQTANPFPQTAQTLIQERKFLSLEHRKNRFSLAEKKSVHEMIRADDATTWNTHSRSLKVPSVFV